MPLTRMAWHNGTLLVVACDLWLAAGLGVCHAALAGRVTEGLEVLFDFSGNGSLITNLAAADPSLELELPPDCALHRGACGLKVTGNVTLATEGPAYTVIDACRRSNEVTLEVWLRSADLRQIGPARIVSLSADPSQRDLTLGQEGGAYTVRLRTTETTQNGVPSIDTRPGAVTGAWQHVVFTRNALGATRLYVDGRPTADGQAGGSLANWRDYRLVVANELTGDRPWQGELRLLAIYSRALTAQQVKQNHDAGGVLSAPNPQ